MAKKTGLGRRSFLRAVLGTAMTVGATAAISGCSTAGPGTPGWTGMTDNDGGPSQDRRGFGRGRNGYTGITDQDSGYYQDAAGNGRGTAPRPAPQPTSNPNTRTPQQIFCTDRDSTATNNRQDPSGYGRCRYNGR